MGINKIKTATVALAGAAAIAGLGALGTGTAAASPVPHDGAYTLRVVNPIAPMLPAIGSVPASIHGGVLTIAGVPVSLLGDGGADGYGLVANGSAWGQLVPR
ncbi:hypothetical protein [Gordonia sputi]|uniref:hypothetical protein n=1 Tax=Gordonia sputi TaxID=36823 RepID=UPI0036C2F6FC